MLANFLKNYREQIGWTQQQLAERANVSLPTISEIERGKKPSKKILTKVLNALCLNIDDLLSAPDLTSEDIIYLENKKSERLYYR